MNISLVIIVIQVLSALVIIGLVLLQHGKGADMGATFGSGASGSLFGATGSSNFLSKSTGVAAAVFFASTLALTFLGGRQSEGGVMEKMPLSPIAASKGRADSSAAISGAQKSSSSTDVPSQNNKMSGRVNEIPR